MSALTANQTVHVRFNGTSHDIPFEDFFRSDRLERAGVNSDGVASLSDVKDSQLKQLLAQHFDRDVNDFNGYLIEHEANGNLTIRPEATFGI